MVEPIICMKFYQTQQGASSRSVSSLWAQPWCRPCTHMSAGALHCPAMRPRPGGGRLRGLASPRSGQARRWLWLARPAPPRALAAQRALLGSGLRRVGGASRMAIPALRRRMPGDRAAMVGIAGTTVRVGCAVRVRAADVRGLCRTAARATWGRADGGGSRREIIGHPAGADPPRVDWVQGRSVFMEQSVLEVEIRLAKVTRALPPVLRQAPPLRSRRAIWLKAFDDGHVCQAARLAHGLEAKALAPRAKRMNQGGHQACFGGAKGMAQRDGATVDVQALRIGPRVFEPCKGNAGECFIDLKQIHVGNSHARPAQCPIGGIQWCLQHDDRVAAEYAHVVDARQRRKSVGSQRPLVDHEDGRRTVANLAGCSCGDQAAFFEQLNLPHGLQIRIEPDSLVDRMHLRLPFGTDDRDTNDLVTERAAPHQLRRDLVESKREFVKWRGQCSFCEGDIDGDCSVVHGTLDDGSPRGQFLRPVSKRLVGMRQPMKRNGRRYSLRDEQRERIKFDSRSYGQG